MNNEELKKKIVEVVLNSEITGIQIRAITGGYSMANSIADALIAAGIGDVRKRPIDPTYEEYATQVHNLAIEEQKQRARAEEAEQRAEIAERALQYAVSEYRCDECPCFDCNAEIRGSQECIDCICEEYKKQAEKELAEESNNDKS